MIESKSLLKNIVYSLSALYIGNSQVSNGTLIPATITHYYIYTIPPLMLYNKISRHLLLRVDSPPKQSVTWGFYLAQL